MTPSACRSAEVASLIGREVFGLVTGLLGGGVRAVLAGLWPVADREVRPLMWRFYRHRLVHELPTALARQSVNVGIGGSEGGTPAATLAKERRVHARKIAGSNGSDCRTAAAPGQRDAGAVDVTRQRPAARPPSGLSSSRAVAPLPFFTCTATMGDRYSHH